MTEPDFDQLPVILGGTHPNAPTIADLMERYVAPTRRRVEEAQERWAPAFASLLGAFAGAEFVEEVHAIEGGTVTPEIVNQVLQRSWESGAGTLG